MTTTLKVGDRVVYSYNEEKPPFGLPPETVATITFVDGRNGIINLKFPQEAIKAVKEAGDINDISRLGIGWNPICWSRVEAAPETPKRPTIDFGQDRWRKAREYAAGANHAYLSGDAQNTFIRVARGEVVDALLLEAVVAEALRLNANRGRNADERKTRATRLMHLHHAAHSVVTNAVDALPAYAEGERSPALKAAKLRIETLEGDLAQANRDMLARNKTVDRLKAEVDEQDVEITRLDNELAASNAARDTLLQVVGYALRVTDGFNVQSKILGFWDALEPGFEHSYDESGGE